MKVSSHIGEVQSQVLQGRRVVVALESQELSSSHPVPAVGQFVPAGQAVPLSFHQPPAPSLALGQPLQLPAIHRGCRDELTRVSPSCCAQTSGSAVGMSPQLVKRWEIHSRGCRASGQWQDQPNRRTCKTPRAVKISIS